MESVLSIKDLSIKIGQRVLMENISLDVNEGEVVLISGANGMGKSTLLKSILCIETEGKDITGNIVVRGFGNVLGLERNALQKYRSKIAYVQQADEYRDMGSVKVQDIINSSSVEYLNKMFNTNETNELIDRWIPRRDNNHRIFDAKSLPAKFSGGEQRLLSVLSVVATRSDTELMIIDEPLNNLDFVNARNISNMINTAIKNNPKMAVLMISHCRIFPFITREIKLTPEGIKEVSDRYVCHSCFGEHDEDGYY